MGYDTPSTRPTDMLKRQMSRTDRTAGVSVRGKQRADSKLSLYQLSERVQTLSEQLSSTPVLVVRQDIVRGRGLDGAGWNELASLELPYLADRPQLSVMVYGHARLVDSASTGTASEIALEIDGTLGDPMPGVRATGTPATVVLSIGSTTTRRMNDYVTVRLMMRSGTPSAFADSTTNVAQLSAYAGYSTA